jgi:hypothetical protein
MRKSEIPQRCSFCNGLREYTSEMTPDIHKEHAIETFKSLIQMSVEGLKLLAVLNGGAAVALLAYLGNIAGKSVSPPDMRLSMGCYLFGLFFCGLAFVASYLTQLRLYNESMGLSVSGFVIRHTFWLNLAIMLALLSLVAFAVGSYFAALRFR